MRLSFKSLILVVTILIVSISYRSFQSRSSSSLNIGILNLPLSLQSWRLRDGVSVLIGNQIHRGLLVHNALEGGYRGYLANRWWVEKTDLVFEIKQGVRFHDGTELRCGHVIDSINRFREHGLSSIKMSKIVSIQCEENDRVRFKFNGTVPSNTLDILASPSASISGSDGINGIGPYKLRYFKDDKILLEKINGKGPEKLYFIVRDYKNSIADFNNSKLDDLSHLSLFKNYQNERCEYVETVSPASFWLVFNSVKRDDYNLRKLVSIYIRSKLENPEFFPEEFKSNSIFPYGSLAYRKNAVLQSTHNETVVLNEIKKIIGKERIQIALRDIHKFDPAWDYFLSSINSGEIFDFVYLSNSDFFDKYNKNALDIFFTGAGLSRNDPTEILSYFKTGDMLGKDVRYSKKIDQIIFKAQTRSSFLDLKIDAWAAEKFLVDESYILIPLYSKKSRVCISKKIKNYHRHSLGSLLIDYSKVEL